MKWLKTLGAILAAILLVLAGAKVGRHKRRALRAEAQAENLLIDRTKVNLEKAAKLQKKVVVEKRKAAEAKVAAIAQLEKISEQDETLEDIADRFNSRRKRKRLRDASNGSP